MFTFDDTIEQSQEKIFLVNKKDLTHRSDPEFYRLRHYKDLERLKKSPYVLKTLDEICTRIVDGPFGSAIKASDYVDSGIPFIRVADVTRGEGTIKTEGMIFISEKAHEKIYRSKVTPGDVVIAKTGATMGAASVIPKSINEANIRGDLGALTANNDILAEFIVAFINTEIGQRLFWRLNSGGTRGRVVIGNLKKYPIIVPPKEKQKLALEKMNSAYDLKRKRTAKAKEILSGINKYLLDEFNIKTPKLIYSNIFISKSSGLKGRLDSSYYKPEFVAFFEAYEKSNTPLKKIEEVADVICGPFGSAITAKNYTDSGTPLIRISNIDNEGRLSSDNIIKIPEKLADSLSSYKVYEGDLIVSQRGSLGLVSVVTKELSGSIISANLIAIKNVTSTSSEYLQVIMGSVIGRTQMSRSMSGQVQEKITTTDVKSISIPMPNNSTQDKLVETVHSIRKNAKVLRDSAVSDLKLSMMDVEKIILGET